MCRWLRTNRPPASAVLTCPVARHSAVRWRSEKFLCRRLLLHALTSGPSCAGRRAGDCFFRAGLCFPRSSVRLVSLIGQLLPCPKLRKHRASPNAVSSKARSTSNSVSRISSLSADLRVIYRSAGRIGGRHRVRQMLTYCAVAAWRADCDHGTPCRSTALSVPAT